MNDILEIFENGFINNKYETYYQPQYNNFTGMLVGAEALARLNGPDSMISPGVFIPILEQNKMIGKLDSYIFESACQFLSKCKQDNIHLVPISINLSRDDACEDGFIEKLNDIRQKYDVDPTLLRIEITESIAFEGKEKAIEVVDKLHKYGFIVELDDFGSGYSSLNILKDVDYDILKLDMGFLNDDIKGKGGTIISSIVRMAKWLKMPVIAEGVETKEQVDFMKSIGCEYTQGYIYSKPLPEKDYYTLLNQSIIGLTTSNMQLKDSINPISFWSEKSLDTLVFNAYAGPAIVFNYDGDDTVEVLRVNKKYIKEIGMNMSEEDLVKTNILDTMDGEAAQIYKETLQKAIRSGEEEECETWRTLSSSCCGNEVMCIRSNIIMIGKSENEYIFHAAIRNITGEKRKMAEGEAYEEKFRNVIEQANIYYWEYTVATKEMRPCFRCMRDLGLPPLLTNYPEPAFEAGIFPLDYADMYRDWHKQIANGVKHLEAVIPLTAGRVPFFVRYDTEFDELGRPIKAYGSATFVTDADIESYLKKNNKI